MDQEIIKMLKSIKLKEDEEEMTEVDDEGISRGVKAYKLSCLGRSYSRKKFPAPILWVILRKFGKMERYEWLRFISMSSRSFLSPRKR